MANEQNLIRHRSPSEARENGRKGGIASGKSRRERKTLKELLLLALEQHDGTATNAEKIAASMIRAAQNGDVKAATFVRDTIGEKPTDQLDVTTKEKAPEGMTEMYAWLAKIKK